MTSHHAAGDAGASAPTTAAHEEKETLSVDVLIPEHAERTTTPLFRKTREALLAQHPQCWICGRTAEQSGHPLEAHHWIIERCLAEMIDWDRVRKDCEAGIWGEGPMNFDWASFDPADPYSFVDDMTVNGKAVCKDHHIGKDEGIHALPFPLWIAQKYAKEGYRFTPAEVIHHAEDGPV